MSGMHQVPSWPEFSSHGGGYLHAFWLMGAILLIGVPVFLLSVNVEKPHKIPCKKTAS